MVTQLDGHEVNGSKALADLGIFLLSVSIVSKFLIGPPVIKSDPKEYTIGWVCAVSTELTMAKSFLDEEHQ